MQWRSGLLRACAMAGALIVAASMGACARKPQDAYAGVGGTDGPVVPGSERDFSVNVGDKVYFDTDSSELSPEAQSTLRGQAQWLRQYPHYSITIEGHADERGTREYNIALGAQRATRVRNYLASLGINPARMRTISYGKERPVATCNDISCWSQNRRAVTVLNTHAGS